MESLADPYIATRTAHRVEKCLIQIWEQLNHRAAVRASMAPRWNLGLSDQDQDTASTAWPSWTRSK